MSEIHDEFLHKKFLDIVLKDKRNIFLSGPGGVGKCIHDSTPVALFDGTIKNARDVDIDDILIGDDGTSRKIIDIETGNEEMFEIKFERSLSLIVTILHELTFSVSLPSFEYIREERVWRIFSFDYTSFRISTNHFDSFLEARSWANTLKPHGTLVDIPLHKIFTELKSPLYKIFLNPCFCKGIEYPSKNTPRDPLDVGKEILTGCNIPREYLLNSRENRIRLLHGLLYSNRNINGNINRNINLGSPFKIPNLNLKEDVCESISFLCRSLGLFVQQYPYELIIYGEIDKMDKMDKIVSISSKGTQSYTGFLVDGNHRFLLGNFMITHNSYIVKNVLQPYATKNFINVAITSTTGVSALSIGGTTIHRWSGIKLGKESVQTICKTITEKNKDCLQRWKECQILVIDEVSMLGLKTFEILDRVGRNICGRDAPFGGKRLIVSGDFLQLPPVQDSFSFKSPVWEDLDFRVFRMTTPKRYPDIEHFEMLMRIRTSTHTKEDIKRMYARCDSYIDYIRRGGDKSEKIKPTRIFSLKKDVAQHNLDELAKLDGKTVVFNSIDKFLQREKKSEDKCFKPCNLTSREIMDYTEFLDTIVDRQVYLKHGAQVMLTYNLSPDIGLVNGSRGVVVSLEIDGATVLFKNGIITRIKFHLYEFDDGKIKIVRHQLPLILAWAISCHKSQGATIDYAIMDLGPSVFAPGMAYVMLSRVRTLDGLLLSSFVPGKIIADPEALEFERTVVEKEQVQEKEYENVYGGIDEYKTKRKESGKEVACDKNQIKPNIKDIADFIINKCPEVNEIMTSDMWNQLKSFNPPHDIKEEELYKTLLEFLDLEVREEAEDEAEAEGEAEDEAEAEDEVEAEDEGEVEAEDEDDEDEGEGDEDEDECEEVEDEDEVEDEYPIRDLSSSKNSDVYFDEEIEFEETTE
jgi:ATP-dependent DNA helicase PIF1